MSFLFARPIEIYCFQMDGMDRMDDDLSSPQDYKRPGKYTSLRGNFLFSQDYLLRASSRKYLDFEIFTSDFRISIL